MNIKRPLGDLGGNTLRKVYKLLLLFCLLNIVDYSTTMLAISYGAVEGNPIAESLTDQQKEAIYSKLLKLNVCEKEARTEHVDGIHKKKAEVAQQLGSNRCPKCGGELIMRKGKYGDFKGCSNYPKCRFVLNT